MSDNFISLIPEDPDYIPPPEAQERARELFERLAPNAEAIEVIASVPMRFIDCGANFSAVRCPSCGSEIDLKWWSDQMDAEDEAGFPLQPIRMPCCDGVFTLNELKYDWPQGFARFSLEAMNPGVSVNYRLGIADLSEEELQQFEAILGCKLRKILVHV